MSNIATDLPDTQAQRTELTESERYRVLADERRRLVLDILDSRAGSLGLDDLADIVVDRSDGQQNTRPETKRVRVSLHHKHLPLLDHHGLVDYDGETRRVRLR